MKKQIINILNAELLRNRDDYSEFLKLREILLQFEGKQLTERVNAKLPEGYRYKKASYTDSYEIETPNGQTHYVAWKAETYDFKIATFEERDAPYNRGAVDRITKLEAILNNPEKLAEVVKLYTDLQKAFKAFEAASKALYGSSIASSYPNPAFHDLLRALEIPSELVSDANYGKK